MCLVELGRKGKQVVSVQMELLAGYTGSLVPTDTCFFVRGPGHVKAGTPAM